MPAYDRFLDLHLAGKLDFDFSDDIVGYAHYQRIAKKNNRIQNPAMIIIPTLNNWPKIMAKLLSAFDDMVVVLNANITDSGTFKQRMGIDFFTELSRLKGKCSISLFGQNAPSWFKVVGKLIKIENVEFVAQAEAKPNDLMIEAKNGGYEIYYKRNAGKPTDRAFISDPPHLSPALAGELAQVGYIGCAVDIGDVAALDTSSVLVKSIVSWLNAGQASKLRVNVHGNEDGMIYMNSDKVPAGRVVEWLCANGLQKLKTFSLSLCHGGQHQSMPAVLRSAESNCSAAEQSSIWQIATALGKNGLRGVKVTGGNEILWGVSADKLPDITSTDEFQAGQIVRYIGIPSGWAYDGGGRVLTVPAGWKISEAQVRDTSKLVVSPPANSSVEVNTTGGWKVEPPQDARKLAPFVMPGKGWILTADKSFYAALGWQRQGQNKLKFVGCGGAIGFIGADIIERLAHSGAKVAMTS